jgi:hypothetical protein
VLDGAGAIAVVGDQVVSADVQVELPGAELALRAVGMDAVRQDEQIVPEVLDLGIGAPRLAVLDGQRVESEDARQEKAFLLGRALEIDPEDVVAPLQESLEVGGTPVVAQTFLGAPGQNGDHASPCSSGEGIVRRPWWMATRSVSMP